MLRPFQMDLERKIYEAWNRGSRNVMMVSPTGSGKTVVLSKIITDESGASIAIAHRQELVSQISIALARNGVRHRIIGNNKTLIRIISALHVMELGANYFNPNAKVAVGGVDTIVKMKDTWFNQVRLMVCDEGHHNLRENKWGKSAALFPNARGLLPTATPTRADGKGLGRHADGIVDEMILAPNMRDIINMGYLTDYRIFAPPSDLNMAGVSLSATTGDFNAIQVRKAVHGSHITGDIVSHYKRFAAGKLGVTFAVDVESAVGIMQAFRANGVPADVVSAKTPDMQRANAIRRFRNREILQLVNCDLFGEGFDLPAIEVVSFGRPTDSLGLYTQQFGRALRLMIPDNLANTWGTLSDAQRLAHIAASNKPKAIIIDHVGNVMRHGLPDSPRDWSLDAREKRGGNKSDAIPMRICINEICVQPYERIHKSCPYCGTVPPIGQRSSPEFVDGDLTELDPAMLAKLRGEITRIDGEFHPPHGLDWAAQMGARKRHVERRDAQRDLRNSIAWWAGLDAHQGRSESESYRRFYFKFGVDVATCQTLGAREAAELRDRINVELARNNIDASVNAELYFKEG